MSAAPSDYVHYGWTYTKYIYVSGYLCLVKGFVIIFNNNNHNLIKQNLVKHIFNADIHIH